MKNKRLIQFNAVNESSKYLVDIPKPALHHVPEWYRKQKNYSNGSTSPSNFSSPEVVHATYKLCVPFIDALTSGYVLSTAADIYVENVGKETYEPKFFWNVTWPLLDFQSMQTLGNYPTPHGHNPHLFRWHVAWQVVTPKGYSLWVTHPSHRYDLPFTTINGFVDTDAHPNSLFLPFFIQEGFEGLIPKGTPFAQLLPIKRESWESKKGVVGEGYAFIRDNILKAYLFRGYKRLFWTKKMYK